MQEFLPLDAGSSAALLGFVALLLAALLPYLRWLRIRLARETLALKNSESLLRTAGDNLMDLTLFQLVHDTATGAFRFSFIGKGIERVLGLDRSLVDDEARVLLDHVHEADLPVLRDALAKARQGLEPVGFEIRARDAGGAYRWLRVEAIPQRSRNNLSWNGFMQDVSTRKDTERTLEEEGRNFENLFETIDDLLVVCGMDGQLLHANPALENRLGYSKEELASMSLFELYEKNSQPEVYRAVARLHTEPKLAATCGLPLQMKNGALVLVETNLFQGTWEHERAIFGVARDVARQQQTENALRESQKMLQLIIDTIPMSIFWKDKDSVYLGCNNAFIHECRLESLDQVVGKTPFDIFAADDAAKVIERDQDAISANRALMNHEESHARPDNSIGWRDTSLIPFRNEVGEAVGVMGVWRDITEQNQAEERLKRTLDDMERFNQLMRGRERRTLELKEEINELLEELGKPPKYRTTAKDLP